MELSDVFDSALDIPCVEAPDEFNRVLTSLNVFDDTEIQNLVPEFEGTVWRWNG